MTAETELSQAEKRETLLNDLRVAREQAGTVMSHTHDDLGGRFAKQTPQTIVGSTPVPTRLIDSGAWPWYKSDLECIRLAIRGCGFMPGHPLKFQEHPHETASAARG